MNNNLQFFYSAWNNKNSTENFWWANILLSIIILRKTYQENIIKIICYDNPPPDYKKLSSILNFEIIKIIPCFSNLDEKKFNTYLLSRVKDCYEINKNSDNLTALIDADMFVVKPFTNIQANKVGLFCWNDHYCNNGLTIFNPHHQSTKKYIDTFIQEINSLIPDSSSKEKYIEAVYPVKNAHQRRIQDEIITRTILLKYKNIANECIYNIGSKNNAIIDNIDASNIQENNNIHLMQFPPNRITKKIMEIPFFGNYIKKFLIANKITEIISKLLT